MDLRKKQKKLIDVNDVLLGNKLYSLESDDCSDVLCGIPLRILERSNDFIESWEVTIDFTPHFEGFWRVPKTK